MKINFKQHAFAFIALFTMLTAGPLCAKDKTAGEKVDHAIDKTEETGESMTDKISEFAHDAKDKAKELIHDAKDKAHEEKDKS